MDEQEIVDLVSVAEGNECDKEEDADENTQHLTQKAQCFFFRAEQCKCLTIA